MSIGKQLFLLFSFILLASVVIFGLIVFVSNDFQFDLQIIVPFSISFTLLILLIRYIVRSETNRRKDENHLISKSRHVIVTYNYPREEWNKYADVLYRVGLVRYYKTFTIVLAFITGFLVLLYIADTSVFYVFLFIATAIIIPIFISSIQKFRKRKNVYIGVDNPIATITRSGILINSEVIHVFNSFSKLHEVKHVLVRGIDCIACTTFHRAPKGGGTFKTSYVPIPANHKNTVDTVLDKLEKIYK